MESPLNLKDFYTPEKIAERQKSFQEFQDSMYVNHKVGTTYPIIEINSLPFPPDNLLPIIETNEFFIEQIGQSWCLRHITNHFFCIAVWSYKKEISTIELDLNDNPIEVKKELMNHYVYFDGTPMSVGYKFKDENVFFLHIEKYPTDPVLLAASQPNLFGIHMAARLSTKKELEASQNRYRTIKFTKYLTENNLQPKGDWEKEQFNNIFGGNPFVLTDDEFEMIFGTERP
jgi:hypothetical protein